MKPLRVAEDVVPIGQFKAQAKTWLARTAETGQPLVITQNGRAAGVLLSPAEFDRLVERYQFARAIDEGLADAGAGRFVEDATLRARLGLGRRKRR
jgi:prevent-host-death family protein